MQVMRRTFSGIAVALLATIPLAASAAVITFNAALTTGQEVPSPNLNVGDTVASPSGFGTGRLDTSTNEFSGSLSWTGMTSQVTRGHIHAAPPGQTGGVVLGYFDFIVPAPPRPEQFLPTTFDFVLAPRTITDQQEAALLAGLEAGALYFNVHTVQNPPGEIRGNITSFAKVPVPASLALIGAGLLAFGATRRRG